MSTSRKFRKYACVLVILGLAYLNYASCYVVGHKELYLHRLKPAAVALWVVLGVIEASLLFYWILMFRGPGKAPQISPINIYGNDSSLTPVPPAFLCDEQGFPYWCSRCQSLKQNRLFHLGDTDFCVAKFDHYCIWVGNVVGRDNYLEFLRFVEFFAAFFVVVLCYTAATTRLALHRSTDNLPHYIVLYVLSVFWIIMIVALFVMLMLDISKNRTTLDGLTVRQARTHSRYEERLRKRNGNSRFMGRVPRKESGVRYVNVAHGNTRKVVPFHVLDPVWDMGLKANLVNLIFRQNRSDISVVGSVSNLQFWQAVFVLLAPYTEIFIRTQNPQSSNVFGDDFGPSFMERVHEKITNGHFSHASYLQHKVSSTSS